ncbi:MAG: hypothetical protein B6D53_00485 [Candidatus Omnitrophica bacterium 4484_49]|nr:CinA family protein [Candidatus Omnitrophota bacterium]OQX84196.1 MAG: hypothetical protein B6D53_00485 [Candidatus Omnitrophica bacterium 4484_49]
MIEKRLAEILIQKGLTLSSAESCTGGLFAHGITNIPGSSKFFLGGVIAYSPKSKRKILNIPRGVIEEYGTVSRECAQKMAENSRKLFSSDISIGITGVAGPDELEGKPVGVVYIAVAMPGKTYIRKYKFQGRRISIKKQATEQACKFLISLLK